MKTVSSQAPCVYVVGGDKSVEQMFKSEGWNVRTKGFLGQEKPMSFELELVCFTGGADVSPYLYGEENVSSHCNPVRDEFEREVYEEFCPKFYGGGDHGEPVSFEGVPMVGICRGGQFLNVMNGGKMIQHIDGHHMSYREIVVDIPQGSYILQTTKTIHEDHHQGIVPPDWEGMDLTSDDHGYKVIGYDPRDQNVEIVWYDDTRCLCFQPHPEWGHEPTKELFFDLINEYIEVK